MNGHKTAEWIQSSSIYEVNLRQYSREGSFKAFEKELARLKDMGVTTLWFMPLTPISEKNKKGSLGSYYACSDYTSVNPEFGSAADLKNLLKQARAIGFKILIDWVANHTGWDHVWTVEHPGYFLKDTATADFKMASGMEDIIELDYKNPALRKAMIDAMAFWINEFEIDGFRCDLAFWVELGFWLEARRELEKIKTLFWLGEFDPVDNPDYYQAFDAAYTWSWMHKTETFYKTDHQFGLLLQVLKQYRSVCAQKYIPVWFTSNHDENSWNGTEFEKYGEMASLLAVFSFTWKGMPLIYSGQELPNKKRLQFFEKDPLEWTGNCELHDFYKTLNALKKRNPALRASDPAAEHIELDSNAENCLVYLRKNGKFEVLTVLNFSNAPAFVKMEDALIHGRFVNIFNSLEMYPAEGDGLELPPWGWFVFEKVSA